jgi:hypothetical protein
MIFAHSLIFVLFSDIFTTALLLVYLPGYDPDGILFLRLGFPPWPWEFGLGIFFC